MWPSPILAPYLPINLKDEKIKEDAAREHSPGTRLVYLAHCFCNPVSKVACVAFADAGVVSSLINFKDEKMKEDAAREPPPGTRGVPLGPLFL